MNVHMCPKSLIIKKNREKKIVGTYFRTVKNWVNFVNLVIIEDDRFTLVTSVLPESSAQCGASALYTTS